MQLTEKGTNINHLWGERFLHMSR